MTVTIFRPEVVNGIKCSRKVRSSQNLRGVLEHIRTNGKPAAHIAETSDGGAYVGLEWSNGDLANVRLEDSGLAASWFAKRASAITRQPSARK